ncbi:MAG TPA: peptidoglycan-binding domain-containing protein, partial [Fibrobacteria bacterium]|nr:peptidoglycan-binding domain-containing protein [Fibrobacteria bacterium]
GPWKTFHDLLYASTQQTFPILVLPGEEVAAALAEGTPGPIPAGARPAGSRKAVRPRLVFGSEGETVKALQRKLAALGHYKGRADGVLGPRAYRAWNASRFTGI